MNVHLFIHLYVKAPKEQNHLSFPKLRPRSSELDASSNNIYDEINVAAVERENFSVTSDEANVVPANRATMEANIKLER